MAKRELPTQRKDIRKPQPRPVQKPTENPSTSTETNSKNWLWPTLLVLAITTILYWPSIKNDYVNWDDDPNITKNPNLEYIDDQAIKNIFDLEKGNVIGNYNPLPIYTFALEKKYLGENKFGAKFNPHVTHAINLVLHVGVVFFVIKLCLALGLGIWGAMFAGLLFGIHPMRVESVAWATERKDVLFAIFYFAALWIYVKWTRASETPKQIGLYLMMLGLAVLSGLSKVQSVSLPLSMLAIDLWLRRTDYKKMALEKILFFGISMKVGLTNLETLKMVGSTEDTLTNYTFLDRLLVGTYSFFTYLYKLFVPVPMSPMYPYERKLPTMAYVSPLIFIAFWGFILWMWLRSQKNEGGKFVGEDANKGNNLGFSVFNSKNDSLVWVFGALFFMFNVMFVLQVFAAGQGYLADRFTYVAYFGFFFVAAYFFEKYRTSVRFGNLTNGFAGLFLLFFAVMTFNQIKIWQNGGTLWTHVAELEGKTISLCWGNRAQYYRDQGDFEKAMADYSTAISVSPNRQDHLNSRGKTYFDAAMSGKYKGRERELTEKAIADYRNALTKDIAKPKDRSETQANLGAALAASGQFGPAIQELSKAIEIDPTNKNAYLNRSLAFFSTQQYARAVEDYTKILEIEPRNANIWYERGLCKNGIQQYQSAVEDFNKAISLDPGLGLAYLERAKAKFSLGDQAGARADAQKAVQLKVKLNERERAAFGL